jgi:hypothetical protein
MRVYILRLADRSRLDRAFERVLDARGVASCSVEPELRRIRFLAPRRSAERLVEIIYLEGGLEWCSRYEVAELAEDSRGVGRGADRGRGVVELVT